MRLAPGEEICFESRRHGVVLARPFLKALAFGLLGVVLLVGGTPALVLGAAALGLAALVAIRAAWRWERTHLVVTTEKLAIVRGTVRRRTAVVPLDTVDVLDLEQSFPGRVLGYGTVVAGPLAIDGVSRPKDVCRLLSRLAA
jgi:membrane protein YdbS with pleckstrin-like domain